MELEELRKLKKEGKIFVLDSGTNRWRIRQQVLMRLLSTEALSQKEIKERMSKYVKNMKYLSNTLYSLRKKGYLVAFLVNGELKYTHEDFFNKIGGERQ